jgi:hypothetical protein
MGIGITLDQQWGSILRYGPNIMESIRSKIGLKIGILVVIQIGFVICSFGILSYSNLVKLGFDGGDDPHATRHGLEGGIDEAA